MALASSRISAAELSGDQIFTGRKVISETETFVPSNINVYSKDGELETAGDEHGQVVEHDKDLFVTSGFVTNIIMQG